MFDGALRQVRVIEELIKARLEVDMAGLVAGMRARLESQLSLEPLPIAADLADKEGPLGLGRVRTSAWKAPRFRKIALSHVAMRPVIEGFALVLLPEPRLEAPIFACDLMALPTRVSANADVYGDAATGERGALLQPLGESFARLGAGAPPSWARPIASGVGLHAKVSLRTVDDAFGAVTAAFGRYLEAVQASLDGTGRSELQRRFFELFHDHGPRRGALGRLFGEEWAERYSRLIFE